MSVSSPAQTVTIGLVQMQTQPEPQLNLEHAVHQVRAAAVQGAQIVCLQELFRSRYFCQTEDTAYFRLAEPIPGPTTESLGQLAASLQIVLIAPVFEQRAPGLYHNSAVIFDADGHQLGLYRKMHIPDDPAYYEKFYFAPGDLGFRSYSTRYGTVGVLICSLQQSPPFSGAGCPAPIPSPQALPPSGAAGCSALAAGVVDCGSRAGGLPSPPVTGMRGAGGSAVRGAAGAGVT